MKQTYPCPKCKAISGFTCEVVSTPARGWFLFDGTCTGRLDGKATPFPIGMKLCRNCGHDITRRVRR